MRSEPPKPPQTTLAESAYDGLRRDIVSGAFLPDMPLRMAFLCERYGMGMSPVREALNRLQAEGLATAIPLRGFFVAPLNPAELIDTTDMRVLIETEALRRSIERGDEDWAQGLRNALDMLLSVPEGEDPEPLHHAFHLHLIAACGSRRLLESFEKLYAEAERYRYGALHSPPEAGGRAPATEHRAIAEATLARDTALAVSLLERHYRRTAEDQLLRMPEPAAPKPKRRNTRVRP